MWTEPWRRIIIISHQVLIWTLNAHSPLRSLGALESAASLLESYSIYCCRCISKTFFFAITLRVADVFKRKKREKKEATCFITHAVCTQFSHIRRRSNVLITSHSAIICFSESDHYAALFSPTDCLRTVSLPPPPIQTHCNPTPVKVPSPTSSCLLSWNYFFSPCSGIWAYDSLSRTSRLEED